MNPSSPDRSTPLIMVIDTTIADVDVIRRSFASADHRFEMAAAHSLAEARTQLEVLMPDLVVTNFRLVDGKAVQLIRTLRDCPVIVISDRCDVREATESIKAGASDFIVKSTASLMDLPLIAEHVLGQWRPADTTSLLSDDSLATGHRWQTIGGLTRGMADRLCDTLRPLIRECEAARDDVSRQSEAYWHLTSAIKAARESQDLAEYLRTAVRPDEAGNSPMRLDTIVREAIRIIKAAAPPSIAIRYTISENNWVVEADPGELRHLVYTVCVDAFQAMPAGGLIQISVGEVGAEFTSVTASGTGEFARLTFRDSRTAAKDDRSPRVREVAGRIAETHGGAINLDERAGGILHVYLPTTQA